MAASNGKRRPPRPRIELVAGTASRSEAAAITAALEQFLADTAAAAEALEPPKSRWLEAAVADGIAARQVSGYAWGGARAPRRADLG